MNKLSVRAKVTVNLCETVIPVIVRTPFILKGAYLQDFVLAHVFVILLQFLPRLHSHTLRLSSHLPIANDVLLQKFHKDSYSGQTYTFLFSDRFAFLFVTILHFQVMNQIWIEAGKRKCDFQSAGNHE